MSQIFSVLVALLAGMLGSLQGSMNSELGKGWSLAAMVFAVSIVQSILALFWLLAHKTFSLTVFTEWKVFLAGAFGVLIMASIAWSISKSGALTAFTVVIFGQLLFSAISDSFGWFGVAQAGMTLSRGLGLGFVGLGILLLTR